MGLVSVVVQSRDCDIISDIYHAGQEVIKSWGVGGGGRESLVNTNRTVRSQIVNCMKQR
jgi:hypothetical protein